MYTEIELNKLKKEIYQLMECEKQVKKNLVTINELSERLKRTEDSSISEIGKKMRFWNEKFLEERKKMKKLRIALEYIVELYEQCEEQIMEYEDSKKRKEVKYKRKWIGFMKEILEDNGILFE